MAAKAKYTGIMAELSRSGIPTKTINVVAANALHTACKEFFKDPRGFGLRFSPDAYNLLGMTRRSASYTKRKMRAFGGRDLPNVSPRRGIVHLRELLKPEGAGHNIETTSKKAGAQVVMTLPGARKQNQYGARWKEPYGREFFTLTGPQAWQAKKIAERAIQKFREDIFQEFNRQTPVHWGA